MLNLYDLLKISLKDVIKKNKKICVQVLGELEKDILDSLERESIKVSMVRGCIDYLYKNGGKIRLYFVPKGQETYFIPKGQETYPPIYTVSDFDEIYLPLSSQLHKTIVAIKNITETEYYFYNDYTISEINQILSNLSLDDERKLYSELRESIEKRLDKIREELRYT